MVPLIIRPEAEADIREIHAYLDEARVGMGAKFIAQLRGVIERLELTPDLSGIVWRDIRAVRLRKFRYVVYYVAFTDRVEVLAVMHGARDSRAWQTRV